jgi:hypothetical protein
MLTTAQLTTLKAAILAETDATFVDYRSQGATGAMANWLNQITNPAWIVWRTDVSPNEYRDAITWTEVDALTTGSKYRIWEWLTMSMTAPIDFSRLNVRQGLQDCWASNTTTRASLLVVAKRTATRAEKLFSTGTGTTATPATLGFEGSLSPDDIVSALGA